MHKENFHLSLSGPNLKSYRGWECLRLMPTQLKRDSWYYDQLHCRPVVSMSGPNVHPSVLLCIVSASLLLDSIVLTMVVPIIPDFLLSEDNFAEAWRASNWTHVKVEADSENTRVGLMLSSKAIVQLVLNPLVGQWANTSGYSIPLFFGTCVLLLSTTLFAAGDSYFTLFIARMCHGVASACIGVTGMCLVADTYNVSESARGRAMGFALSSAACGVLIGYPFGGFFYDLFGKTPPFVIISLLVLLLSVIELHCLSGENKEKEAENAKWRELAADKRVLICGGTIGVSTIAMAILEPCLPIWLIGHIKPKKWQLGTAFIPDSLGYALGTNAFSHIAYQVGRVKVAMAALLLVGFSCILIPMASSMMQLVIPHFLLGLGIGAADAAMVPLLAALADAKANGSYGTVYTVQQTAVSLAYAAGPLFGGALVKVIGFPWLMTAVGIANIAHCLLITRLLERDEQASLLETRGVQYSNNNGAYRQFPEEE